MEFQAGPTIERVRAALRRPLPGVAAQRTMAPQPRAFAIPMGADPRRAAVLLLLYPRDGALHVALTLRPAHLGHHAGQVSLPGGGWEAGDASLQATALREACEELGICGDGLDLLGPLTPLYVPPSNNLVHPFVAYSPARPAFRPDPREVAELLEVPLAHFLDALNRREEVWTRDGAPLQVPYFAVGPHKVWGATAIILAEFAAALRTE
jgi:8-oxo-dGTP pyrophosphatase MutT (NUDIX family)